MGEVQPSSTYNSSKNPADEELGTEPRHPENYPRNLSQRFSEVRRKIRSSKTTTSRRAPPKIYNRRTEVSNVQVLSNTIRHRHVQNPVPNHIPLPKSVARPTVTKLLNPRGNGSLYLVVRSLQDVRIAVHNI